MCVYIYIYKWWAGSALFWQKNPVIVRQSRFYYCQYLRLSFSHNPLCCPPISLSLILASIFAPFFPFASGSPLIYDPFLSSLSLSLVYFSCFLVPFYLGF